MNNDFQKLMKEELNQFLLEEKQRFPVTETLKIDLHCHDYNSDIPDELIGRILNVPETWLPVKKLLEELQRKKCDTFTVTNHNNARSCYELQDKGYDILTGAEFSCMTPDFGIGIHVLAYGFTPEQEVKLEKLRKNVYHFQEYARASNIPTIWAHPLYHYAKKQNPSQDFFDKMMLIFERFEVLNGQRDTWQNLLVKEWIQQTAKETIDKHASKFGIDPIHFCIDPYRKSMSGGSDCHFGIFAGMTGTYLHVPQLKERLKNESRSQLALEAILNGRMSPYGMYQNTEKMTIAFLNYACQIALNYKDPGLLRLILHKGTVADKIISLTASNLFCEVQKHKVTTSFLQTFNDSMTGKKPPVLKKLIVKSAYKPIFKETVNLAKTQQKNTPTVVDEFYNSILSINDRLYAILAKRLDKRLAEIKTKDYSNIETLNVLLDKLELPSSIRAYINKDNKTQKKGIDISGFLDDLSFPFFGASFILAAHFTSAKTLYQTRPLLRDFSKNLGKYQHPERILWLTDTFGESNGISTFLKQMHLEIKKRNLPIDIVCCHSKLESDDHLTVLKPVKEFSLPFYSEQDFKIPNFVELHNLFLQGGYDRIICSTEGVMGLFGLYLKHAYTVEASFYMHTDWLMFARKVLNIEKHNLNRVKRILRSFYKAFDKIFVLNSDQKEWLSGSQMNLPPEKVHKTAHWVNPLFMPKRSKKESLFGITDNSPVLLYVGRISHEKGVLEIPAIYEHVKQSVPQVKMVFVGKGPAQKHLKKEMPKSVFIDWVDQNELSDIYSSANLLVLPSRFDTFCNVVLEALSCGLPVIAYKTKGPKDIIRNGQDGFLVDTLSEMQEQIIKFLQNDDTEKFKTSAIERSQTYNPDVIIAELMKTAGKKKKK
jgi:glycosyltransferase involved in cell wall biosynthesis